MRMQSEPESVGWTDIKSASARVDISKCLCLAGLRTERESEANERVELRERRRRGEEDKTEGKGESLPRIISFLELSI